ncbi:MAG: FG-GAP-like repeat-containing protein [Acidobacteriota bacterium]|nr:FG-GAP-like repeat-containing protein [Acidobacteriota bacterium]
MRLFNQLVCLIILALLLLAWPVASQQSAEQLLRQARAEFDQRKFAEAAATAKRAHEADPKLIEAWKLGGLSFQLMQNYEQAEAEFENALKLFPTDAELWFYLARVQFLQSSLTKSASSARRAIELKADSVDALTQLAMTLDALNDSATALTHYRRAMELCRAQKRIQPIAFLYASQLLLKLGQFNEATDALSELITANPKSSQPYLLRGTAYEKLGKLREAEKDFQQSVLLDGNPMAKAAIERLKAGVAVTEGARDGGTGRRGDDVKFRDVAAQAKLQFTLRNSASPRKYQVETMTGGVAVIDFDGDGWEDIYFVNGAELPAMKKTSPQFWNRLFRNNRQGGFVDVTEKFGVAGEGFSMGVAVADYDNDGDADIFVAGVNQNILFRNDGGRFSDVTAKAGLTNSKLWSVAAAWFDYDNDGDLDLFVANYCKWHVDADPYCGAQKEGWRTYCFPDKYEGLPNQLFRNNGDGTFTDVSASSGIGKHIGKGMGVTIADYDEDGLMDVFVANDTLPNFLFRNLGGGKFEEVALSAGVAVNESGRPVSSMGADFRDYDNDGRPDLIFSALEGETFPLFRNLGKGFFGDVTWSSGVGAATVKRSGWSLGLFDFNNDGWKDLFTANAHVNDNIELYNEQTYRQSNSLLMNLSNGNFLDATSAAGEGFQIRRAHRGAAFADFDNDGRVDVVTTSLNEPAELWRNEPIGSGGENNWLKLRLIGARSNRDGIGAKIKLTTAGGKIQFNHVTTSVGYASSSSRIVHFGLGKESSVKLIEIRWPSGIVQVLRDVKSTQLLEIKEPSTK